MTCAPAVLADLLAECQAHGIRLSVADDDGLEIDAPRDALTPDLLEQLKAHKADVLAALLTAPDAGPAKPAKAVCHCGSTTWRDAPIHGGQSIRRDCAHCRRFIDFPVWHGKSALHYE